MFIDHGFAKTNYVDIINVVVKRKVIKNLFSFNVLSR